MFDDVLLESEQEQLLATLVEGARSVRREERGPFLIIGTNHGDVILGDGVGNLRSSLNDVTVLVNEGLLHITRYGSDGTPIFDITPRGFKFYEFLKSRAGKPIEQVEDDVTSYLDSDRFQKRHPAAYQKWLEAQRLLWTSDSERQFTTIGHFCRESMQEFADDLVRQYQPPDAPDRKDLTFARVRAVLQQQKDGLGEKKRGLFDAVLAYWDKAIDLVQRQEHGGQKRGDPLVWEDARRAVFQTAIVEFEIDRALP